MFPPSSHQPMAPMSRIASSSSAWFVLSCLLKWNQVEASKKSKYVFFSRWHVFISKSKQLQARNIDIFSKSMGQILQARPPWG